jgi:Kef-type K+ transport system membrane component KefB
VSLKVVSFGPMNIFLTKSFFLFLILLYSSFAYASGGSEHAEMSHLLIGLLLILLGAKIGGDIAIRLGQPEVLGELLFGVLLGNLALIGFDGFTFLKNEQSFSILSELGVIFLLFLVGLETNLKEMASVGASALVAAILGVIAPFVLGYFVSSYFLPLADFYVHVFVGATLTATSVGITARVLKDMGKVKSKEGQLILGAAVIDDVLGLLVLAVVTGVIQSVNTGAEFDSGGLFLIIAKAIGFLVGAVFIGNLIAPRVFEFLSVFKAKGVLLASSLSVCFGMSYLAGEAGLAPIVGAFTAGLILDPIHYKDLSSKSDDSTIEHLVEPIASLLVPIFFVIMGARVDLSVFGDMDTVTYALVLTLAAVLGKQVCGLGVLQKGINRVAVGFGMIPRGEVGLIFIGIGAKLSIHGQPLVDAKTFGAVVIMVILTTMLTPPLIKWKFGKL